MCANFRNQVLETAFQGRAQAIVNLLPGHHPISRAGWILPLALITQRLQLGDSLQISRATGRPLDLDQPVQAQTSASDAEQRELNGIALEILVPTAAYDFAEEIQRSQIGDQGEIEATFDRVAIQAKGKTGRSSS